MGFFSWFTKKKDDQELLPDIKRVPVDPEFSAVLDEYSRREDRETLALCLEGGGAKGIWQAGFAARMAEVGLMAHVDVIAGTSVGGLNATVIARYMLESPNLQKLVDIWRGIKSNDAVYKGKVPDGVISGLKTVLSGRLSAPSLLDIAPLHELVNKHLAGYNKFHIPVYTVATDYVTKGMKVLGPGTPAVDMALATSAVPVCFPPHNGVYMDGGCVMNCPFPFLIDAEGATKVVVLYCDPDMSKLPATAPAPTSINTGTAALTAMFQVQSDRAYDDLERMAELRRLKGQDPIEIAHFYPSVPTGTLLEFGAHPELLQKGYDDAVKYLTPQKVKDLLVA